MKKVYIITIFILLLSVSQRTVHANEYLSYQEVEFEYDCVKFIGEYNSEDKDQLYDQMTKLFWGWNVVHDNRDEKVTYKKETLYVIKNEGYTPIKETFSLEEKEVIKRQYSVSGSIGLKGSGKEQSFSAGFEQKMSNNIDKTTTTTLLQEFTVSLDIDQGTELHVEVLGEGLLSNGVAKYFVFGKSIKKGEWEVFTVSTEYYSIRKEKIDGYVFEDEIQDEVQE